MTTRTLTSALAAARPPPASLWERHGEAITTVLCAAFVGAGWLAHRVYHLFWVPTLSHKARVLADWTLALFFRRETTQLTSLEHPEDDFRAAIDDAARAA